jgi:anthranilate phosphoribosyltransferase
MAKWAHADVLDNGPAYIKANCNKLAVISAYTSGDSYATVNAAILAEATMANADFTLASSGNNRTLTTASGKQDTAANAGGTASHLAFVDTVASKVLWVTDETSGQVIFIGNPVTFPSLVYTSNQPT